MKLFTFLLMLGAMAFGQQYARLNSFADLNCQTATGVVTFQQETACINVAVSSRIIDCNDADLITWTRFPNSNNCLGGLMTQNTTLGSCFTFDGSRGVSTEQCNTNLNAEPTQQVVQTDSYPNDDCTGDVLTRTWQPTNRCDESNNMFICDPETNEPRLQNFQLPNCSGSPFTLPITPGCNMQGSVIMCRSVDSQSSAASQTVVSLFVTLALVLFGFF